MNQTATLLGVGLLGSAIADRLTQHGWQLTLYDPAAAYPAASEIEAATNADTLIFCVPNSNITTAVAPQLFPVLAPNALIIDCTTGDPSQMEALAAQAASHGHAYIDATVAGSSAMTRRGEVLIMAGAEPTTLERARPLLEAITTRIIHIGPPGCGARMKLVNNLALGLHRAVLAEALHLATALGIDEAAALNVLREGPGYSRIMDYKGDRMLHRNYTPPEARLAQHHKDVRLMLEAAAKAGIELPLTATHDQLLAKAEDLGYAAVDNSAIREVYRKA